MILSFERRSLRGFLKGGEGGIKPSPFAQKTPRTRNKRRSFLLLLLPSPLAGLAAAPDSLLGYAGASRGGRRPPSALLAVYT